MPNPKQEYLRLIASVLTRFQLLEEALKEYVIRAHKTIEGEVSEKFDYHFDPIAIRNYPLARLTKEFAKLGGSRAIIDRIEPLIQARNGLAHTSYVLAFDRQKKMIRIENRLTDLIATEKQLFGIPRAVVNECGRFGPMSVITAA